MAVIHGFAVHNGEIVPSQEIRLSPFQTGLLSGWGLFSTLRIYRGVPFALEDHLERLRLDAGKLHVQAEEWLARTPELFERLIERNAAREAMARLYLIRNHGGLLDMPGLRETDLLIFSADLRDWGGAAKLRLVPNARQAQAALEATKSLSWARNLATLEEVSQAGFNDALLLNERGEIAECTSANLFLARGGKLMTPPLSSGALPGVSRKAILRGCAQHGLAVEETTLFPADLRQAEEVFISSSTREVQPVSYVDDLRLPPPGPVIARVRAIFDEQVEQYIASHRPATTRA